MMELSKIERGVCSEVRHHHPQQLVLPITVKHRIQMSSVKYGVLYLHIYVKIMHGSSEQYVQSRSVLEVAESFAHPAFDVSGPYLMATSSPDR